MTNITYEICNYRKPEKMRDGGIWLNICLKEKNHVKEHDYSYSPYLFTPEDLISKPVKICKCGCFDLDHSVSQLYGRMMEEAQYEVIKKIEDNLIPIESKDVTGFVGMKKDEFLYIKKECGVI